MCAIQFRHFNSLQDVVSPVQVPAHPVHREALCYSHSTIKYLSTRDSKLNMFTCKNKQHVKLWINMKTINKIYLWWQKGTNQLTTVLSLPFLLALQILSWLVSDQYTRSVTESKSMATMLRPSRTSERTTLGCVVMSSCTIWFRLATSKNALRESVNRQSNLCYPFFMSILMLITGLISLCMSTKTLRQDC